MGKLIFLRSVQIGFVKRSNFSKEGRHYNEEGDPLCNYKQKDTRNIYHINSRLSIVMCVLSLPLSLTLSPSFILPLPLLSFVLC